MTLSQAGEVLSAEARRFAARGWMMGTAGNLSVRLSGEPLQFAITASGKDKGELTAADVALAGPTGAALPDRERPEAPKPSAEAGLHARIYQLASPGAIFHVHTVSAVVVGETHGRGGVVEVEGLEMLKGIGREAAGDWVRIPVLLNSQDMSELAETFEKAWEKRTPGVIVAGHGLYAWGKDPLQARHHVEIFEWLFQYLVAAGQRG